MRVFVEYVSGRTGERRSRQTSIGSNIEYDLVDLVSPNSRLPRGGQQVVVLRWHVVEDCGAAKEERKPIEADLNLVFLR